MELRGCVGGCAPLFLLALLFDALGFVLLFVGIFANVRVGGVFYGDFLIYTGALVIFMSLGFWVMWYVWNIPTSGDDGSKKRSSVVVRLARKLTERLNRTLRPEDRAQRVRDEDGGPAEARPPGAGRVTWGRSTAYRNEGYDDSPDKKLEEEEQEGQEVITA